MTRVFFLTLLDNAESIIKAQGDLLSAKGLFPIHTQTCFHLLLMVEGHSFPSERLYFHDLLSS